MSAWILSAVALCVCASGCDMVPPVKMVNQTTFPEPIPVRKTTVEACNACISVATCELLWQLVSQWCAAWNNDLNSTCLILVDPSFSGELQSFPFSTKLIGEIQIFRYMFALWHKSSPGVDMVIQGAQHDGEVKYIPKDNPGPLQLDFDGHFCLEFDFQVADFDFSCWNFTQLATDSPALPGLLPAYHLPPALHSTPMVDPTKLLQPPFKHCAAFGRAPTPPLLLLLGVTDHPNQTAESTETLVFLIEDPPHAAYSFIEHPWAGPYPFVWGCEPVGSWNVPSRCVLDPSRCVPEPSRCVLHAISSSERVMDALMDLHLSILVALVMPLVFGLFVLVGLGVLALLLDTAMAMLGVSILIAQLDPQRSCVHVMPCIMNMVMRLMTIAFPCKGPKGISLMPLLEFMLKVAMLTYLPVALAAGSETPKVTLQEYFLPGVTRWDGIPYHDFRRVWWVALCAALGNINQEGWSLLQTARNQDLGSTGNPGTTGQAVQSANRNQRLFGAILNYIEATSMIYRYVSATFANDGRGLFNYLYQEGHLPYTSEQRTSLENEWTDATMARVGIRFTADAVFRWASYVDDLASKLNKSERDKRVKYLAGFPASFDVMIVPERARGAVGSYTHPANYPAHHPQAGTAHPNAGQPDIMAIAHGFYSEWARMIDKGMIKTVPKGMAYQVRDTHARITGTLHGRRTPPRHHGYRSTYSDASSSDDDGERANMARERINSRTVCGICGGIGHAGKVDGVGTCLTARLGNRIPHGDLARMTYPDGYNPPRFMHKPKPSRPSSSRDTPRPRARAAEREQLSESSHDDEAAAQTQSRRPHSRAPKPHHRNSSRRPQPRRARHVDDESHIDPPPTEPPQTSDRSAESHESDHDEHHSRLAVAFESIEFP